MATAVTVDRRRARAAFEAYAAPYDRTNERIALKVAHTYRVASLGARIAAENGWDAAEVDLAWLCCLLHDIGRFEQLRRWDTFNDAASASHAAIGVDVLFSAGAHLDDAGFAAAPRHPSAEGEEQRFRAHLRARGGIRQFVADTGEDGLIRAAVAYHSAYRVPAGLDARTRAFCDLVRDADKVDILRVWCESSIEATLGVSDAALAASPLSPETVAGFYAHRTLTREERRYPADALVNVACFAFELVYPASLRIAREQGYLFQVLARPMANPATAAAFARMERHLRAWTDGTLARATGTAAAGGAPPVADL